MELVKYGIVLKRLKKQDIEMVRMWRNSEFVKQYMEFRDHITIEMQKKWFTSLSEKENYYFIIYHDDYPVGLTEIKNISNRVGNLGIFIADEDALKIPLLSFKVILTIIDFGFEVLSLETIEASILKENIRAIRFNEKLGFKIKNPDYSQRNQIYTLKKSKFFDSTRHLRKMLSR